MINNEVNNNNINTNNVDPNIKIAESNKQMPSAPAEVVSNTNNNAYVPKDASTNKNLLKAVNIAKAIRQHESGGNYEAKGGSGEGGAYQFMPSTWKQFAKEVLGDENAPQTPVNQNRVASMKIKSWLDKGMTIEQVAAKWNSGSEVGWENKVSTGKGGKLPPNKFGQEFSVPAYVKSVKSIYDSKYNLEEFSNKVDEKRIMGLDDTSILDKIGGNDPKLNKIIQNDRKNGKDDTNILNSLSLSFSGKMPAVPSIAVPQKGLEIQYEDQNKTDGFGKIELKNPIANAAINNPVTNFIFGSEIELGKDIGTWLGSKSPEVKASAESLKGLVDQNMKLQQTILDNKAQGKDTTRLERVYNDNLKVADSLANEIPAVKKNWKEIAAEFGMVGIDLLTAGAGSKFIKAGTKLLPKTVAKEVGTQFVKKPIESTTKKLVDRVASDMIGGGTTSALYEVASNPDATFDDIKNSFLFGGLSNVALGQIITLPTKIVTRKVNALKKNIDNTTNELTAVLMGGKTKVNPEKIRGDVSTVLSHMGKEDVDNLLKSSSKTDELNNFVQKGRNEYGTIVNKLVDENPMTISRNDIIDEYKQSFAQTKEGKKLIEDTAAGNKQAIKDIKKIQNNILNEVRDFTNKQVLDRVTLGNRKFSPFYGSPETDRIATLFKLSDRKLVDAYRTVLNRKMDEVTNGTFTKIRKNQGAFEGFSKYFEPRTVSNKAKELAMAQKNALENRIKSGIDKTKVLGNGKGGSVGAALNIATYPIRLPVNVIRSVATKNKTKLDTILENNFSKLKDLRERTTTESILEALPRKTHTIVKKADDISKKEKPNKSDMKFINDNKVKILDVIKKENGNKEWDINNIKDHPRYDILNIMGYNDADKVKIFNENEIKKIETTNK